MRFALVNGVKTEASKGTRGICRSCGSEVIAKCGEINANHWAHKGNHNCDPWWESETVWHRSWKGKFPTEWQEVIHSDKSGEKHIADVKTQGGWVLEFQHSYLNPEERRSRNAFYPKLVWVVDGTRRKTDKVQFQKILDESTVIYKKPQIIRVHFPDECRLLKEWHTDNALVFFDFKEADDIRQSALWFLFPKTSSHDAYLSLLSREAFIELHSNNKFNEFVKNTILPIHKELSKIKQIERTSTMRIHQSRLPGIERYLANRQRRQRRF